MASCINKAFMIIYIRKSSGEIKSSNGTQSLNSAELNRTCPVAVNIIIISRADVLLDLIFLQVIMILNM